MFSLNRTPSQDVNSQQQQQPIPQPQQPIPPPPQAPTPPPTVDPVPNCESAVVSINLQVQPVLDLTVCKPKLVIKNFAECVPCCDCE